MRFVFGLACRLPTSNYRHKLGWMTVSQRRKYFLLTLTYRALKIRTPPYLYDILRHSVIDDQSTTQLIPKKDPFFKSSRMLDASFLIAAMTA